MALTNILGYKNVKLFWKSVLYCVYLDIFLMLCDAAKLQKVVFNTQTNTIVNQEYCMAESFKPRCSATDEVVTMLKADYGRMNTGQCIKEADDSMPCSTNYLGLFDRTCSGKRSCDILIPNAEMKAEQDQNCPENFIKYLDASHRCQKVLSRDKLSCDTNYAYPLTEPTGLLSSVAILEADCDDQAGSFIIDTHPGQSINFTLMDFGWSADRPDVNPSTCSHDNKLAYGYIAKTKTLDVINICAGRQRMTHVALVKENQVQIVLKPKPIDQSQFILKYEVLGCTEPNLPSNTWSKRDGHNLIVGCEGTATTQQTWKLMCQGNTWIGSWGNCNKKVAAVQPVQQASIDETPVEKSGQLSHNGALILIIVGSSTLIIILVVVIVGVVCIKRQAPRKKNATKKSPRKENKEKDEQPKKRKQKKNLPPLPPKSSALLRNGSRSNRNSAAYQSICVDNSQFDLPLSAANRKSLAGGAGINPNDPMAQSLISECSIPSTFIDPMATSFIGNFKLDPMTSSIISDAGAVPTAATLKYDPMTRSIISTDNGTLRYEHPMMRSFISNDGGSLKYERLIAGAPTVAGAQAFIKNPNGTVERAIIPATHRHSVHQNHPAVNAHHMRTLSMGQEPEYFILEPNVNMS